MNTNSNPVSSNNAVGSTNEAFLAQFKLETGWNYGDAVAMAVECRTEDRLFGNPRKRSNSTGRRPARTETPEQKFTRETGWSFGDAVDMAAEVQRENRLFGRRHLN